MTRAVDDAVVVGGGLIGLAVAAELAKRGFRVTVLERAEPGSEASGAAAGMLTPQEARDDSSFFRLALQSRNLYPAWAESLREETGLDVGYRRWGLLHCAFDPAEAQALGEAYRWQTESGLRVEERAGASLSAAIEGRLSPEVRRAVFFPDEAAVDPPALVRAVWLSAQRRGVRVLTGVSATRFHLSGGVCRGVETDAGLFEATSTVDAAGAWAAFDPTGRVSIPVHPVKGQIVQLRVEGTPLATMVSSEEVYLVPRADGTVLLGSTLELTGFRKGVTAEAVERLLSAAVRLVPALRSAPFLSAWSGLRPGTPDGLPILGRSPIPGLFVAAGHFRNGILLAPITAVCIADLLTGGAEHDLSAFSVERFFGSLALSHLDEPPASA